MKKPPLFIRLAVVASSLLLVGGCISYRVGAFDWLKQGRSQMEPNAIEQGTVPATGKPSTTFLPSTKRYLPDGYLSGLTPAGTFIPDSGE